MSVMVVSSSSSAGETAMRGYLFDDLSVKIDPRSTEIGGAWQGPWRDGYPVAFDPQMLRFFYGQMQKIDAPCVLDVGANTGSFCLLAVRHVRARVVAIEPNPLAFEILTENIALNSLERRVRVLPWALSDRVGSAMLKIPSASDQSGLASLGTPKRFNEWTEVQVHIRTLDSLEGFLDNLGTGRIDLMKIDTEGAELLVLRGGERLIRKHLPGILLEYDARNTRQFDYEPAKLRRLLQSWGYRHFERFREDLWATV